MTAPTITPMSDEEECELCGGTGEVLIAPHGDHHKSDHYGCPLCMSTEFAEERAAAKSALSSSRAEVETLRTALRKLGTGIIENADDTVWCGIGETAIDFIFTALELDTGDGQTDTLLAALANALPAVPAQERVGV